VPFEINLSIFLFECACFSASAETPSESGSDFGLFHRNEDGDSVPAADKANYYKEKLKALQNKAGLGNNDEPVDNRADDFNRNHQPKEVFHAS